MSRAVWRCKVCGEETSHGLSAAIDQVVDHGRDRSGKARITRGDACDWLDLLDAGDGSQHLRQGGRRQ